MPHVSPPARRRWFRLSLRTLFIVITVACCWLGWELSIVRQRQSLLNELRAKGQFSITTAEVMKTRYPPGAPTPQVVKIPLARSLLGDAAIQEIWYQWPVPSEEELARIRRIFPEAELHEALPEPCHPGCFPRGTLVETPGGPRPIDTIRRGDSLSAFAADGRPFVASVQTVFITDNRLWRVETDAGELITTETQPLCIRPGKCVAAGQLRTGDTILRLEDGSLRPAKVLGVARTERIERVFNVILGDSEAFVANGFLARSKPPERASGELLTESD